MLDTADILADRKPALGLGAVERPILGLAGEADEVPGGIDERVERVGLASTAAAARGAIHLRPGRVAVERIAGLIEADIVRKHHRKLVARHRHGSAAVAMDDRDRSPPVTLARHAPVSQTPDDRPLAPAFLLGPGDDGAHAFLGSEAVEP